MRVNRPLVSALSMVCVMLVSASALAQETQHWKILALRVEFPEEVPDSPTTTGDGTFDLRGFEEAVGTYEYPYDTPPHDRTYFESHLTALANYYRTVSEGRMETSFAVFPEAPKASYRLARTMISYGNGRTPEEVDRKLVELFRDAIVAADSAEGERLDFSEYDCFLILHAGVGRETGTLNDIRSAYLTPEDLERHLGGPIPVDEGQFRISDGILVPEAIGTAGTGGLNGTLAKFFGHQLGLPGLSNFRDGLPAIGGWSLMDIGANLFGAGLVGFVPCHPMIWSKIRLGWVTPVDATRDTTVWIAATDVLSDLPKGVKVSAGPEEYFLIENRQARREMEEMPEVLFSRGDSSGVWLSVDAYDAYVPGSGILIWHVDDAIIAQRTRGGEGINDDPLVRGIDLEEADGYEDIGNLGNFDRRDEIDGSENDPFFAGGRTTFSCSTAGLGAPAGIRIEVLSPPQDTMAVRISFDRNEPGWPRRVTAGFGAQAPKAADIGGDEREEVIAVSSDGTVYIWNADGTPFGTGDMSGTIQGAVMPLHAIGDLEGDGALEIVVAGEEGDVSAWRGTSEEPFLIQSLQGSLSANPVLVDVDPSDGPEIVVGTEGGEVVVLGGAGTKLWGVRSPGGSSVTGLAAGDLGVGRIGIVGTARNRAVFVVEGPAQVEHVDDLRDEPAGPPVLADLDGDGETEIIVASAVGRLSVFSSGERVDRPGAFEVDLNDTVAAPPAVGDLDGDGFLEIVVCGVGQVHALRFNGIPQAGFPARLPPRDQVGSIPSSPVLADLDDDGAMEILFGSLSGYVYALDGSGRRVPGFPLPCDGPVRSSPLIGDLDRDGIFELVALTEDGWVHVWDLARIDPAFRGQEATWPMAGRDLANTSAYAPSPVSPAPPTETRLLSRVYCYPNPVDEDRAHLRFFLSRPARIQVKVFDVAMDPVAELSESNTVAGTENEILWDTTRCESGLYLCRMEAIGDGESEVVFVKVAVSK